MELEGGIEKVQVLKGKGRKGNAGKARQGRKGKEREGKGKGRQGQGKARQGKGKAGKFQRIERRKELNWLERKNEARKSSSLGLSFLSFLFPFSSLFLILGNESGELIYSWLFYLFYHRFYHRFFRLISLISLVF